MERWDLYTEDRKLTGETHIRGMELPENKYHMVVHVWIKNSQGKYLISQRSANRPTFPLMWECVGGSVLYGESSLQGAVREVWEEVGIDLGASTGKLVFTKTRGTIGKKRFNDILDVWFFEYDGKADLSRATTDEVCQTQWLAPEQIRRLYQKHLLVDTLEYFFQKIAVLD